MPDPTSSDEPHSLRGPTDRGALLDFLKTFQGLDPMAAGALDDFLDPAMLRIDLADGIGPATAARLDVVWTTQDDYSIHYTDDASQNLRWGLHPNEYPNVPGDAHFHPPPTASSDPPVIEESCIAVTEIELVARAVQTLWRYASEQASFDGVNALQDPP